MNEHCDKVLHKPLKHNGIWGCLAVGLFFFGVDQGGFQVFGSILLCDLPNSKKAWWFYHPRPWVNDFERYLRHLMTELHVRICKILILSYTYDMLICVFRISWTSLPVAHCVWNPWITLNSLLPKSRSRRSNHFSNSWLCPCRRSRSIDWKGLRQLRQDGKITARRE